MRIQQNRRRLTRQLSGWRERLTKTLAVRLAGVALLVGGLALLGFGTLASPTITGGHFKNVATTVATTDDECDLEAPAAETVAECSTSRSSSHSTSQSSSASSTSAGSSTTAATSAGATSSKGSGVAAVATPAVPKTGAGADITFGVGLGLMVGGSTLLFGARPLVNRRRKN
jgi:hypothetical protein